MVKSIFLCSESWNHSYVYIILHQNRLCQNFTPMEWGKSLSHLFCGNLKKVFSPHYFAPITNNLVHVYDNYGTPCLKSPSSHQEKILCTVFGIACINVFFISRCSLIKLGWAWVMWRIYMYIRNSVHVNWIQVQLS